MAKRKIYTQTFVLQCLDCGTEFFTEKSNRKKCNACVERSKREKYLLGLNLGYSQQKEFEYRPMTDVVYPDTKDAIFTLDQQNEALDIFNKNKRFFIQEFAKEKTTEQWVDVEYEGEYFTEHHVEQLTFEFV